MSEPDTPNAEVRPADVRKALTANHKVLARDFVERDEILQSLTCAALAEHHALLVGPPGTAKSMIARAWSAQFSDATYRETLLTRQTTEDQVLCYLDVPSFMNGERKFRFDGSLPEAHFAFVDECFKATGGLLNAQLGWLNERTVRGFKSPLITAIGASNEFGEDDSVLALEDRFLFRHWVSPIAKKDHKIVFLRDRAEHRVLTALQPITLTELSAAQAAVRATPLDDVLFGVLADLQVNLNGIGIEVSDRRLGQCLVILQAYAWIQGDTSVGPEHLDVLRHVLWRRPEDKAGVDAAIGAIDKGIVGEIRATIERALEPYYAARAAFNAATGTWSNEAAKLAYLQRCPAFLPVFQQAGEEVKAKLGAGGSERVKLRAKEYLAELREAFVQARADCKGAL